MSLGDEVKKLREAKGLSQQSLADAVGVDQTFVSKLEKGNRDRLGADVYLRLCDALGVGCDHFRQYLAPAQSTAPQPAVKPTRGRPKKSEGKK